MRKLPSGTVTFLFTDIEGSTFLTRELGDRYLDLMAEHRRVLRAAFTAHAGAEVDTQGDSFFAAFARASDAVAAAAEGQRGLAASPFRVRMGLHTGEPQRTPEGYVGLEVVRGARIADIAHGGQVLLSQTTRDLVPEIEVRELGEHRLKDLPEPVRIFQLGHGEFPPPRSLNQSNLSLQLTTLVGRRAELEETARLIRRGVRLITLVGPPGAGKTRLGLQLASDLADRFRDGVFLVGLAPLADASLVEDTIAQTVGAKSGLIDEQRDSLVLRQRRDGELVLARDPQGCAAGHDHGDGGCFAQQIANDGRGPRDDRAASVGRQLAPNPTVAAICGRLDRLPLAIELAAARTKVLSPQSLLARLDRRLPLLVGGPRDAPERQQTLKATIDWSYQLLEEAERALLARLSVFAGGCTPEAAEVVCDATLDSLGSLVDMSLLAHDDDRFTMLETIREYALERLDERGELETTRARQAEYFLELAGRFKADVEAGLGEKEWPERLAEEEDNLRAVLEWSRGAAANEVLPRLVELLYPYWALRGHTAEARSWLERALESEPTGLLGRKLVAGTAHVAGKQGDLERAGELFDAALALNRAAGDTSGIAICLHAMNSIAVQRGDYAHAAALEAGMLFEQLGDATRRAAVLHDEALLVLQQGDARRARELLERELTVLRTEPSARLTAVANALADLGFVALVEADTAAAWEALREGLAISRDVGSLAHVAECLTWIASLAVRDGDADRAARLTAAADRLREQLGITIDSYAREIYETTLSVARGRAPSWDEGWAMPTELAIELALAKE